MKLSTVLRHSLTEEMRESETVSFFISLKSNSLDDDVIVEMKRKVYRRRKSFIVDNDELSIAKRGEGLLESCPINQLFFVEFFTPYDRS